MALFIAKIRFIVVLAKYIFFVSVFFMFSLIRSFVNTILPVFLFLIITDIIHEIIVLLLFKVSFSLEVRVLISGVRRLASVAHMKNKR